MERGYLQDLPARHAADIAFYSNSSTVTEATTEKPFFLLPMDTFYFMGTVHCSLPSLPPSRRTLAPDLANLECDKTRFRASGVPPTADPAFLRYAASAYVVAIINTV